MFISPNYQYEDFQYPLSIDDKITIFEDRVLGWKLYIANQLINGKSNSDGIEMQPLINHAGYATLDIIFSYFEMIAKYEHGFIREEQSNRYFNEGIYMVFPNMKKPHVSVNLNAVKGKIKTVTDEVLDLLYKDIRCGLYHIGSTTSRIILTADTQHPMSLDIQNMRLVINPHILAPTLISHFNSYIIRLRDPKNQELRDNFEVCFDNITR